GLRAACRWHPGRAGRQAGPGRGSGWTYTTNCRSVPGTGLPRVTRSARDAPPEGCASCRGRLPQHVEASDALHVFLAEPERETPPVQGDQLDDAGDDLPGVGVPARIGKAFGRKEPDIGMPQHLLAGHPLEEVLVWVDEPQPGM